MIGSNSSVLKSLIAIKRDPSLSPVLSWLLESLRDVDQRNRRMSGEALYRGQGEAQTLEAVMPGERSIVLIGSRDEPPLWRRPNDTRMDSVDQLVSVDLATGRMGVYGFRVNHFLEVMVEGFAKS